MKHHIPLYICFLAGLSTACSQNSVSTAPVAYPTATVGVSMSGIETNAFFKDMYNSFKSEGEKQPSLTLLLDHANNNQETQYKQLDEMIAKGAKALVVNMVDVSVGADFVKKYCDKNIPVVYINRNPGDKNLAQCKSAYFVDGDASQAGVLQGLKVLEAWKANPEWDKNKDGVINYAMLKGIPGHAGAAARTKWSIGTMQNYPSLGVPVNQVFEEFALFNKDKAKEIMTIWLNNPAFNDVEVILANNDNMALGAIEALKERNLNTPVFGIDGGQAGRDAVKAKNMVATVFNDYDNQAKTALRVAANLVSDVAPTSGIDYRMEYKVINVPYQNIKD